MSEEDEGGYGMELSILKNEEKRMNLIMFLFLACIPCVAMGYVLLFNGGSARDCIVLAMVLARSEERRVGKECL